MIFKDQSLVKLRLLVSNAKLVANRQKLGYTQNQFAKLVGISASRYRAVETLRILPSFKDIDNICGALGQPMQDIFPESILNAVRLETFRIREKQLTEPEILTLSEARNKNLLPVGNDPEDEACSDLDRELLKNTMEEVVASLTKQSDHRPRNSKQAIEIIRYRFGLSDGSSHTLKETAQKYGLTAERIRQIEVEYLKRLRHPSRSGKLKQFLYLLE